MVRPDDQHPRAALGGPGDGQHVVEAHRHVGEKDLHHRLPSVLSLVPRPVRRLRRGGILPAQFAEHLPADPEQQDAARKRQADDSGAAA